MGFNDSYGILALISDVLSIITISTCFILKIPQIINVIKVRNAMGINLIGLLMELGSYTIMYSYNYRHGYALLTYLEYPIILIQQLLLICFVLYFKSLLNLRSLIGAGVYLSTAAGFLLGVLPREILVFLVPFCTPIGASAKVVQLIEICRTRNSESVSLLTWFISAFTNFTRIITTLIDSGDTTLLLNFTVNTALSSSIMLATYCFKPRCHISTQTDKKQH